MTRTEDNGEIALMTQPPQMEASNTLRLGLLQQAECQSTRQIDREREARAGTVQMSGDICIWRRAGLRRDYAHRYGYVHAQTHDPYKHPQEHHEGIWKPL
jgi:hypothetical protein